MTKLALLVKLKKSGSKNEVKLCLQSIDLGQLQSETDLIQPTYVKKTVERMCCRSHPQPSPPPSNVFKHKAFLFGDYFVLRLLVIINTVTVTNITAYLSHPKNDHQK